jgi:N-acetylglutamate synthase-like GNAT family acetyltransferase
MQFEPLVYSDFPYLKEFEPPNWGDLVPRFKYHIDSTFCNPLKLTISGKMVAIGTVIFHKDSAWLASIIVHPDHRNNGYGRKITQKLIDHIDSKKFSTTYLDATDLGYPVYIKLGFEQEATYAHLKSEENVTGLKLSGSVISYNEKYLQQILQLDKNISCECRQDTITENLATARVYINDDRVEGFYLPSLGNGLIIAKNDVAGIELVKYRLENNYFAILPSENETTINFLKQNGLVQFRISRRMFIGKEREWQKNRIYNRISGQLG